MELRGNGSEATAKQTILGFLSYIFILSSSPFFRVNQKMLWKPTQQKTHPRL
jgi:hypothetical protein